MRVLVCTDRIGALSSAEAGAALARAFVAARPGTDVAVVAMGSAGEDLAAALSSAGDPSTVVHAPAERPLSPGIDGAASSTQLGRLLADVLRDGAPGRVVLDLSDVATHDGGAGILGALGARADVPLDEGVGRLAGLTTLALDPARRLLGATELDGVVPGDELGDLLLGLRGVTARRAHLGGAVAEPATMLATDASLGRLAGLVGVPDGPGIGAAGGAALAVVALGGWLTAGPALVSQAAGLERTASVADLVVTGCDALDAVTRGGPVVGEAAAIAERAERPCVLVAGEVGVSGRELRTFGIEAAHAVGELPLTASDLTERSRSIALSWSW